ncbi:hypothetical protein OG233_19845 [Streptomyces sp. NBC_01218]|uniref:hypothetical protein n=1 Tax=Streptomyces sp. NBC_01218 TaxID=2903780 RepID=UPI002E14991B|nr:hypothetical protein OG233_19845 [Streptomyces sp. NBC_01218]
MESTDAQNGKAMRKKGHWAACGVLLVAGFTACGEGAGGPADKPAVRPASQMCDDTLRGAGGAALRKIGGTDEYWESEGSGRNGDPYEFSLRATAKRLREGIPGGDCRIYLGDRDSDFPLIDIHFVATAVSPVPAKPAGSGDDYGRIIYPVGSYAAVGKNEGAMLYFACPTAKFRKAGGFVKAEMYLDEGMARPSSTARDRIAVLNAVSRGLAEELGCGAEAKLPAAVPEGHRVHS